MKFTQIIIFVLLSTLSFGQSLEKEIDNIYDFKPSELTYNEQSIKIPMLDKFWNKVKNDTLKYLPLLRAELKKDGHNPFFYWDGSSLLLSLTRNKADKELSIEAITKCDLEDISQKVYVMTLNNLANEGLDVTEAAIKILLSENYSFIIPQHAMTFSQGYCLTYMLLPQQNTNYVDTLTTIFKTLNSSSQKSIITTLWFAYSCKGDIFLNSIMVDETLDKEVREYTKNIMSYTKLSREQKQFIKSLVESQLNNLRKDALKRFSDEAIEELDMTTRVQRKESNCHK